MQLTGQGGREPSAAAGLLVVTADGPARAAAFPAEPLRPRQPVGSAEPPYGPESAIVRADSLC